MSDRKGVELLSYDVARCSNETCPLRHNCRRAIDPGHPTYQAFMAFPGGEDCHGFMPLIAMTDRKDALMDLLTKVEAGGNLSAGEVESAAILAGFDLRTATGVIHAYRGSLDAAKALHEAVLPKSWFQITECSIPPKARATITTAGRPLVRDYRAKNNDPARAWLICILKTLIAEED